MNRSTKRILTFLIVIFVVLVIIIFILAITDKTVVSESEMGQTIIEEMVTAPQTQQEETAQAEEMTEAETQVQLMDLPNEKEIRLYLGNGGNEMDVVPGYYNSSWSTDYDIATFEAINSTEDVIYYDDYFTLHQDYWDAVDTAVQYKIGYEISFDVDGEHKVYTILSPGDISNNPELFMGDADYDEVTGYLGVWVYCDMYQTGPYIHLTEAEMTEDTLMTSIKLRPTADTMGISNLKLTAFSYSTDKEFDSEGHYIGTHGFEVSINNQ